ncbi:MAG: modification methylase, partial [Chloroflexi bacterium]|nr:modification methylase [Chloroflexota bacterium]
MNRILFAADCLDILKDSSAIPDASIDLIYLDPPFNS